MTTRKKKTVGERAAVAEAKARKLRARANDVERAKRTRQLILQGEGLAARIAAGDPSAKAEWDKTLDGLKRDHDRAAFDLEPLAKPGPDNHLPVNPPTLPPLPPLPTLPPVNPPPVVPPKPAGPVDVKARFDQALDAWNDKTEISKEERELRRVELGEAIAGYERVSGQLWTGVTNRRHFGLGDRPGEILRTA